MSTFGDLLKVTTYGESHGLSVGCIIEGFPAGFQVDLKEVQKHLDRRRPGQSSLTTSRNEEDKAVVQSGIQQGVTLGTPICILIANNDTRPSDYSFRAIPRPGHADFTYKAKYDVNSDSGGGRASARETAARVAAGGLCLSYLEREGIEIVAWVQRVGVHEIRNTRKYTREEVERLGVIFKGEEAMNTRCPDYETAVNICEEILKNKEDGDSIGGIVRCYVAGLSIGNKQKTRSLVGYSVMSIPSVKGFRVLGGCELEFEVAFKPVSTIGKPQKTCDWLGEEKVLECKGRHDPCVLPRAVAIVESMTALAVMNIVLWEKMKNSIIEDEVF